MTPLSSRKVPGIALYGIDAKRELSEGAWNEVIKWMVSHDASPELCSLHGKGFAGKPTEFSRGSSRLASRGFKGIEAWFLFSLIPGATIPTRDWRVHCGVDLAIDCCFLVCDPDVACFASEELMSLLRSLVSIYNPKYGIGFERERRLGPDSYCVGLAQGLRSSGSEYEEAINITRWGMRGIQDRVFERGVLRDVYRWNLINSTHLARNLSGGIDLKSWIRAGHGQLDGMTSDTWLWTIEPEDIPGIRETLTQAQLIFRSA
jgi:hypothetical protein